jgi:hypothetical protein
MTNTNKVIEIMDFIEENGLCYTDKICVFCSTTTDGWNSVCYSCNDYKGMMKLPDAIEYYGTEIIGY